MLNNNTRWNHYRPASCQYWRYPIRTADRHYIQTRCVYDRPSQEYLICSALERHAPKWPKGPLNC